MKKGGNQMLFVLDAGNTNIVLGVYKNEKLIHHWRMETIRNRSADEYGMFIKNLLQNDGLKFEDFDGIIISSVVPPIMFSIERMCEKYFKIKPIVVGPGVKTGLNIKIENPREVGADRIVNAVSAIHEYGAPLILIDFGTATTYCYVDENKNYHGGAIAPGIGISTEALYTKAAKLPYIELTMPDNVIGKNTVSAMQSGILFGNVGQVEGIVARMSEQSTIKPTVIATGGLASLIASEARCIDHVDPFLTLKGLHIIYKKNC